MVKMHHGQAADGTDPGKRALLLVLMRHRSRIASDDPELHTSALITPRHSRNQRVIQLSLNKF
ncbi:MAG: hypothetical protein QOH42_1318 [Blastocatellia bacterium]|nr:hypothetical protein [Blastocatellia bacterium]